MMMQGEYMGDPEYEVPLEVVHAMLKTKRIQRELEEQKQLEIQIQKEQEKVQQKQYLNFLRNKPPHQLTEEEKKKIPELIMEHDPLHYAQNENLFNYSYKQQERVRKALRQLSPPELFLYLQTKIDANLPMYYSEYCMLQREIRDNLVYPPDYERDAIQERDYLRLQQQKQKS